MNCQTPLLKCSIFIGFHSSVGDLELCKQFPILMHSFIGMWPYVLQLKNVFSFNYGGNFRQTYERNI